MARDEVLVSKEADLNMQHVNINEFCDYIKDRILMEEFTSPILGLGKSGIGKTECIENAICKPMGIGLIEMRLGSYSETDLTGFPIPEKDPVTGQTMMRFADVSKFPHEGRDPEIGILLLDEFTNARPAVRGAALQLTDKSRSIGDYKLPPKWLIVIMGNGPTDGGYFQGLEYALMGRADCFRVDVSFPVWREWALANQIHPAVLGFIESHNEDATSVLHRIKDMEESEYEQKDANPRSWVKLSEHLKKKEERVGGLLDSRQVTIYAGAAIGADMAPEFSAYYEFQRDMLNPNDVLAGKFTLESIKKYRDESLYMSTIGVINRVVAIMNDNQDMIESDRTINDADEKKIDNMLHFVKLLADSGKPDQASSIISSLSSSSELWLKYLFNDDFHDRHPEFHDMQQRLAVVNSYSKAVNSKQRSMQ